MKRVKLIALTIALCWNIPFVTANDQWYQVDLVVFRYTNNASGELWPAVTDRDLPDNVIPLHNSGDSDDAYVSLPAQDMLLNEQSSALGQKGGYQVLAQRAWRMPVSGNSPPVAIRASIDGQEPLLLDGTVTVSMERFLHVDVDLWLNKLAPANIYGSQNMMFEEDIVEESGPLVKLHEGSAPMRIVENFQLKQRRRIKSSKDVHYLDSPEIGVLVKLTPV